MIALLFLLFGKPILEFFEEADAKKLCRILGVEHRKLVKQRQLELIVLGVVLFLTPMNKKYWIVMFMILIYKRHILQLRSKMKKLHSKLEIQFSIWLRMLEVLMAYNTVPKSIALSIDNAPDLIKPSLIIFAEDLALDPLDRALYTDFLSEFDALYIERAMHHLYHFALLGNESSESQLAMLVEDNAMELSNSRKQLFESKLGFFSWFGLLPMLWVSLVFLGLMFMVVSTLMQGGWTL